jgi:tRNA(fMet)-specific endonuclease VapC
MSFLLDTDICSAYLKGDARVGNRVTQYAGRLGISAITAAELFTWALRAKASPSRLKGLLEFFKDIEIFSVDSGVSRKFGEIRAAQLDHGQPTPAMDLLVAATAIAREHTLVTHNIADYINVPGLDISDWLAP